MFNRSKLIFFVLLVALALTACTPIQPVTVVQAQEPSITEGKPMQFQMRDLTLMYQVHGEGQPVLLLHGWPSDHQMMVKTFEPIFRNRPGWQRVYVDLPGMGATTGGSWIMGNDDVLEVLVQFMDEVYPDQRFLVIGFSYGGFLARGLLYKKHEQMDGLFLLAPNVPNYRSERILAPHRVFVSNPEGLAKFPAPFDRLFAEGLVVQSDAVLALMPDVVTGVLNADEEMLNRIAQKPAFSFPTDLLPAPFEKPVLILTGKHDSIVGYEQAGDLVKYYPRATYAVLDRAGHNVYVEQPALFTLLVNEWLDRVEEAQE